MSIAGIRSNRGDGYQTLIAFNWALSVMTDPQFEWIEIDSISSSVDDVVIGKADGTLICCQCKKNQVDFESWKISDLADDLQKAAHLLASNIGANVRFYSRSPFGEIAKLREYCMTQNNDQSYADQLSQGNKLIDTKLANCISSSTGLTTFKFLRSTTFETSPELDVIQSLLIERLGSLVTQSELVFKELWTSLDFLGMREKCHDMSQSTRYRLTKNDLIQIVQKTGAMMTPNIASVEVRKIFERTSAIGRSWYRDILGKRIPSPTVQTLISAIGTKHRSILLTGLPGSGKTCVLLDLQDELERQSQLGSDRIPLFIQSREFADFTSTQEREAQGLHKNWVEYAARLAENTHVVIIIDSLDVLSIAREHSLLTYFLAQIDQLLLIPNITVITACRDFDLKYDYRLERRTWDRIIQCHPLDWDLVIVPLLKEFGIDDSKIDSITRELICNPRGLSLYVELATSQGSFNIISSQSLAQRYLDTIIQANPNLGDDAM